MLPSNQAWARVKCEPQRASRCTFSCCPRAAEIFLKLHCQVQYITSSLFLRPDEQNDGWHPEFKSAFFSSRANPSMLLIALNVINSILVALASVTVTGSVCCQTRSCQGEMFLYLITYLEILCYPEKKNKQTGITDRNVIRQMERWSNSYWVHITSLGNMLVSANIWTLLQIYS